MPAPGTPASPRRDAPAAGLCDTCRFQREVRNTRGSSFSLCGRSREDPAYPRYPRLPVLSCAGYERRDDVPDSDAGAEPGAGRPQPPTPGGSSSMTGPSSGSSEIVKS
jgi:hypothetical protein